MIIIFVEFIDQLIDKPINCASLTKYSDTSTPYNSCQNINAHTYLKDIFY